MKTRDVVRLVLIATALIIGLTVLFTSCKSGSFDEEKRVEVDTVANVINGRDLTTGLIASGDYALVKAHCTACHSSDIILQAHLSREHWLEKIHWMQQTQGLWDLGTQEKPILDYLATYYGVDSVDLPFRKPPLKNVEWYKLED